MIFNLPTIRQAKFQLLRIHYGTPYSATANPYSNRVAEYVQGLPDIDNYTAVDDQSPPPHVPVVLDDLINESSKLTGIPDMFTRKNHHKTFLVF
jgi:hypothetical protein